MRYEIGIDNIILTCDIHSYEVVSPQGMTADDDWDAFGYTELEFTVESALELDEDGLPFDLSSTEIDKLMADEWFVKLVEKEILKIIEAEKESDRE